MTSNKRKTICFLTGTRADFGKLKPLIRKVAEHEDLDYQIFATGMHLLQKHGRTILEISKSGFSNIHAFNNQYTGEPMELVLANTIGGLSRFLAETEVDLLVVHGDRVEALAGAIVGSIRNVLVAHVEGGENSGTIDELIRHAVTKMSHIHFVATEEAREQVLRFGEAPRSIYLIGSPDVDVMLDKNLPTLAQVLGYYEIPFEEYGIVLFHPVTTELDDLPRQVKAFVDGLIASGHQYIVIYPNNDAGTQFIFEEYKRLEGNPRFLTFASMRFEYFLVLLRHARFIVGNSSAGIREAPIYGVPSVNVGSRQANRSTANSVINTAADSEQILQGISQALELERFDPHLEFGTGNSAQLFIEALEQEPLWQTPKQKSIYTGKGLS